jgi:hypothetical protein
VSGGYEASIVEYEGVEDMSAKDINIVDMLKGESKKRWIKKYGRYDENATMMKRDIIDIQVHFAKCQHERDIIYKQEVPLFDISGISVETPVTEGVAV